MNNRENTFFIIGLVLGAIIGSTYLTPDPFQGNSQLLCSKVSPEISYQNGSDYWFIGNISNDSQAASILRAIREDAEPNTEGGIVILLHEADRSEPI